MARVLNGYVEVKIDKQTLSEKDLDEFLLNKSVLEKASKKFKDLDKYIDLIDIPQADDDDFMAKYESRQDTFSILIKELLKLLKTPPITKKPVSLPKDTSATDDSDDSDDSEEEDLDDSEDAGEGEELGDIGDIGDTTAIDDADLPSDFEILSLDEFRRNFKPADLDQLRKYFQTADSTSDIKITIGKGTLDLKYLRGKILTPDHTNKKVKDSKKYLTEIKRILETIIRDGKLMGFPKPITNLKRVFADTNVKRDQLKKDDWKFLYTIFAIAQKRAMVILTDIR
jgi:hypothetical protein